MWSHGSLQESACVLFGELEQTAGSDSDPSVDFGEFCVLVRADVTQPDVTQVSTASHHFPERLMVMSMMLVH